MKPLTTVSLTQSEICHLSIYLANTVHPPKDLLDKLEEAMDDATRELFELNMTALFTHVGVDGEVSLRFDFTRTPEYPALVLPPNVTMSKVFITY